MAERRMFAKSIIDSDAFLDMPLSTQALYFHLSMRADDEGFVGNPKRIRAMIGASEDDLKLLIVKRFVLAFPSGVVVIKHWRIHNYIQNDRCKPTTYIEERDTLTFDGKKAYTERGETDGDMDTKRIQDVSEMDTQVRLVQVREDKGSIGEREGTEGGAARSSKRFEKPTLEELIAYCNERGGKVNPQQFFDFYESKGWRVGNQPMKDWRACVRTWETREGFARGGTPRAPSPKYGNRED